MRPFFDLQVNGYAGVDFNDEDLTAQRMAEACRQLMGRGVDRILATIITAPLDVMVRRVAGLAQIIETQPEVAAVVAGIHIEGPFLLNEPGYVGAHPAAAVIPADRDAAERLVEAGRGQVRLWTLAPEVDPQGRVIGYLRQQGIVVAAGHCNPTRDQLQAAIDQGLQMFTHLGNGCPVQLPRHDHIINRVLSLAEHLKISLIADGQHVPAFALKLYLQLIPEQNIVIVSDAISAAGLPPGCYPLGGQTIRVDQRGVAWAAGDGGNLAGSTADLPQMFDWLVDDLGFSAQRVETWMSDHPRALLGR